MQRKSKLTLLAVGALLSLTAIAGAAVYIAKTVDNGSGSSTAKASNGDTHLPSLPDRDATASGESSNSPGGSSIQSNPEIQDGPYITCDKQALSLTVGINDTTMPFGYFTPEIKNASNEDGQTATRDLAICGVSDTEFLDYLDFKTYNENDQEMNAVSNRIVVIRSGKPVKCIMKRKPPIAGGYQVRLRVYSPYYDSATVRWFIDVNLQVSQ